MRISFPNLNKPAKIWIIPATQRLQIYIQARAKLPRLQQRLHR
jgi:hypothetical protein